MNASLEKLPEPWLRGTLRAVVHALELAKEDLERHCGGLNDDEVNASPCGLPPVGFQLRHIARSIDRLLTYAEGRELSAGQIAALKSEFEPGTKQELFEEAGAALADGADRVRRFNPASLEEARAVGKKRLPTTVAGLLVHVADHTQRHVGQAITTAKVVLAQRTA